MRVNRISRARRRAAVSLSVAALAVGATTVAGPAVAQTKSAPAAAADCSAAYRIEQKLASGTTWQMCWHYESEAGLVLENISYQPPGETRPIKVLTSAKLGQIHVPYDDGKAEYSDLTGAGFGQGLMNMAPGECPGGTIKTVKVPGAWDPQHPNVKGLCTTTRSRGHAYRMQGDTANKVFQAQGKDLLVYTVNQVGWYEYITEWRFQDDGTINMNVGATGSLSPVDYDAGDGRGWPSARAPRRTRPATATTSSGGSTSVWTAPRRTRSSSTTPWSPRPPGATRARPTRPPARRSPRNSRATPRTCAGGGSSARPARTRTTTRVPTRSSGRHHQVPRPQLHQARHLLHRVQEV